MMREKLHRTVDHKERYYCLSFEPTLFGDFCLERIFGASRNKKPTGTVREYFADKGDGEKKYLSLLKEKLQKGYKPVRSIEENYLIAA